MPTFTLISFKLCPYVQRVAIALAEKQIPFETVYVDLGNRPDWFKAISPLGKVPLLRIEDVGEETVLFESSVICEYIEDINLGPALHPSAPIERARHRAWMEFCSAMLGDIWRFETAQDEKAQNAASTAISDKLTRIETVLGAGPYFGGDRFSLVDAVFAPAFRYFDVFETHGMPSITAALPKVSAWRKALAERPSVKGAVVADYPALLTQFLVDKNAWLLRAA